MNYFNFKLLVILTCLKYIYMISSSSNEPLPPNELGEISKDCSEQYCLEKDSLSLWLSLQNVCVGKNANPYFLEINNQETEYLVVPIICASLCGMISLISFIFGYILSHQYYNKNIMYSKIKENDF